MLNLDKIISKSSENNDKNWPFRILIIGPSGSGKTNALLNLIQGNCFQQIDNTEFIDKIYLYAKDLSESKYQLFIEKRENVGTKHLNDPNAFTEYSNDMNDAFSDINNYNPRRKRRVRIVFDDMIADIMINKKFQAIIKELFIRCRKFNISIVFITQSYFRTPKDARSNSTHYVLMKIQSKRELQNIAQDNSDDIDFKDILKIYKECTNEPYSFMTIDTTLSSSDPMRFRKNFSEYSCKNDKN